MYITYAEILNEEKYKNIFTKDTIGKLHRSGYLKALTNKNGEKITTIDWLEEAIILKAEAETFKYLDVKIKPNNLKVQTRNTKQKKEQKNKDNEFELVPRFDFVPVK